MNAYNGIFYKLEYNNYDRIHVTDGMMAMGVVIFTVIKYIFWSNISPYLMALHCLSVLWAYDVFSKHSSLTIKMLLLIFDHFVLLDLWSGFMYNCNGQVDHLVLLSLSIINVYIHKHTVDIYNKFISLFLFKVMLVVLCVIVHPYVLLIGTLAVFITLTNEIKFNSLIGISVASHILTNYYLKNNYNIVFNNLIPFNLLHILCTILISIDTECVLLDDRSQYGIFIAMLPLPLLDLTALVDIVRLLRFLTDIKRDYIFNPPKKVLCVGIFDILLPSDLQFIENEAKQNVVDIAILDSKVLLEHYNYTSTLSNDERDYIMRNQKNINNAFVIRDFNDLYHIPDYLKIIPMINITKHCNHQNLHDVIDHNDSLIMLNSVREIVHQNYYRDTTRELERVQNKQVAVSNMTFRNRYNRSSYNYTSF